MDIEQAKATFRSPSRADYQELDGYTRDDIYRDSFGPGGLYLAARMVRTMRLAPGDLVLDLGCGRGETSIFLARHFGVRVVAVDLWTPATFLNVKFTARGYRDRIVPLHLDVTGNDGGLASSIAIRTGSGNSVVFDKYRSDTGIVEADTESLKFTDAMVGTSATFANLVLRVLIDYKDAKLNESSEPHDTGYIPFYMIFTGTKLATNANADLFVKREQIEEAAP